LSPTGRVTVSLSKYTKSSQTFSASFVKGVRGDKLSMLQSLTLRSKILILISVPLILELALLGTVAHLQNQAEDEARRAEYSRQIADEVIALTRDIVSVKVNFGQEDTLSPNPNLGANYKKLAESIDQHFLKLKRLTEDKPALSHSLGKALDSLRQSENLLNETRRDYREAQRHGTVDRAVTWLRLRDISLKLSNQLLNLGDIGKAAADASPDKQRHFREQVQQVLIGGGIANILLTLLLGNILTRSIVNRLKIMNDNSYRLAVDKPLNKPVSGNDEIAHLDRVFHHMASELRDAFRKEKAILENASDCICSFNSLLKFVSANPACEKIFALSQADIIGADLLHYLNKGDTAQALAFLSKVKQGVNTTALALTINHADGTTKEVLWSAQWAPYEGNEGEVFSIFHDVSEHRAAERLKQEVVAMVTHDLRTPLTTVQNYLQFLSDGLYGDPGEKARQYLPGAQRSSERMMRLIGDLLDIEKINSDMMEVTLRRVSVQKIFENTLEQSSTFAKDLSLVFEIQTENLFVYADEDMLLRILSNLVSNAIKFSPQEGIVTLSAQGNGQAVTISISDQGAGLAPEMLESVFDRFQQAPNQTARTSGGSGLGLAVCKALVALQGGKIWAEANLSRGSRFHFQLPQCL